MAKGIPAVGCSEELELFPSSPLPLVARSLRSMSNLLALAVDSFQGEQEGSPRELFSS
jgi:hypothetical protein